MIFSFTALPQIGAGGAFDFELPEYDFLGGLTEKTDGLAKALAVIIGLLGAAALGTGIGKFVLWLSTLKPMSPLLKTISGLLQPSSMPLDLASSGLDKIRASLSPLAKIFIGSAGFIASLLATKEAFYDVTMGTRSWSQVLPKLTLVLGAVFETYSQYSFPSIICTP